MRPGDKWQDRSGLKITVTAVAFNRVTFIRDGYEYPCTCTPDRLRREFIPLATSTENLSAWRASNHPLEKTKKLRELILNSRRGQP
ncbi:DUF4222 domain-containing protein [Erwinia sp. 198]|uniref:DUF4222 domain-containing protein n=1 Tax=Erwinia sp. 198 TaxID=2022746 RepID=UPI000F67C100|nr:DUF4222 domain-containing protein [Erwinia sp. 198]